MEQKPEFDGSHNIYVNKYVNNLRFGLFYILASTFGDHQRNLASLRLRSRCASNGIILMVFNEKRIKDADVLV